MSSYINSRGHEGPGTLRLKDAVVDAPRFAGLLSSVPTNHCLVLVESSDGAALTENLRAQSNAVVISSSDNPDIQYDSGLQAFWEALSDPAADVNGDKRISVGEAFDTALGSMDSTLKSYELYVATRGSTRSISQNLPRLDVGGNAAKDDFWANMPSARPAGSQGMTYALVLKSRPTGNQQAVPVDLAGLCPSGTNCIIVDLEGLRTTTFEQFVRHFRSRLTYRDRFILYIDAAGHESDELVWHLKLSDGDFAGYRLGQLLSELPTSQRLVIARSAYSTRLVEGLTMSDGAVIAAGEHRFSGNEASLTDFWTALGDLTQDANRDGAVSVQEAFDAAFNPLLLSATSPNGLAPSPTGTQLPTMRVRGHADANAFSVAPRLSAASAPSDRGTP